MADMKYLNTRVQLKYDSYENWTKAENQKDLLPGEIAIAYLGPTHTTTAPDNSTHPVLFKVGPGKFNALPWASALAADVYEWAKCEHVELDGEVIKFYNGTDKANPKHSIDLSKFALDSELGAIASLTTANKNNVVAAINELDSEIGTLSGLQTTVKTDLVNAINEVRQAVEVGGTGSVVTVAKEATPTAGSSATYVIKQGDKIVAGEKIEIPVLPTSFEISATATDDDVVILTGTAGTNGVTYDAKHAKKGPTGGAEKGATAEATVNGYGATATIKVPKVKVDEYGHVNELSEQTLSITMPSAPEYKTLTIGSKTYNTTADVEITAADLGLSNAMHFIGAFAEAPENPVAGDVYLNTANHKEYVYDSKQWIELGDEGSHALKTISITGTDGLTGGGTLESNREIKLSDATKASLVLADNSKQKQTAVASKFTASAHVLSSLSQNENGDIAYEVKELTPADIGAQPSGDYALKRELPVVNDGKFTVSGTGALSGSGEMTANQSGNTTAALDVKEGGIDTARLADAAVTTAKIADHAVGAHQTKACQDYTGNDAEVWVFCCGSASTLI